MLKKTALFSYVGFPNVRKGSCVEVCTNDVDARETIDLVVVWGRVGAAPEEVVKPEFSVCVFSGEEKIH